MKILITGSAGYVGKNLLEYFLHQKHDVVALTRQTHDLRNPLIIEDDSFDFDVIVHVAGNASAKSCIDDPYSAVHDNIISTYNVLEYARSKRVKKFIFFSTCDVYTGNLNAKESDVPMCTNMYSATKLSAEHLCESYFNSYGFMDTCVVFRLIHSYGKYCQNDRFPSIVLNKFKTEDVPHFVFRTQSKKRWIGIQSVCEKTHAMMLNFSGHGVFNLVGDENLTLYDFVNKMSNGRKFTYEYDTSTIKLGYPNESNALGDKLNDKLLQFGPS